MDTNRKRYFIEIVFKGTNYHGWQVQKNALSVQELLDKALTTVFRQEISSLGCGRTDAGVHAKQLYAHFDVIFPQEDLGQVVPQQEPTRLLRSINALLPSDIAAKALFQVKPDAHARFDALSRSYEYHVHFDKNPFLNDYSWQMRDAVDLDKMNQAAQIMLAHRDFSCFSKSNTQVFTNNCEISYAQWRMKEDGGMVFEIRANRFLRNMVRAIVGTLVEIGKGNQEVAFMQKVLDSKDRSQAGTSVPACGLYLTQVLYPKEKIEL